MKIPEDKIQEIRDSLDIAEIISDYVTLKKKGKSLMGLCPFHREKTPSFSVDPVRGFYHCFGCNAGGDCFNFIMDIEKITFPESVKVLAERAGISLRQYQQDDEKSSENDIIYYTNNVAKDFYIQCLYETRAGGKALAYIKERRFDEKILKNFQIGYAPNRWDGLILKAKKSGIPLDHFHKAGLIIPRKTSGGFYDRFRGRLIFPIMNSSGRVVGFGGRILKANKDQPKYINSPETIVYKKGYQLYGLNLSKEGIRKNDKILLVEGYTDVMRLYQSGFDYAVSTSGTALTDNQAAVLSRYSKNVILLYDGDSAGFNAALRGVDILFRAGIHVNIAPLPGGTDPDSFLLDKGKKNMDEYINSADSFVDFRLKHLKAAGENQSPIAKAEAAKSLINTVLQIKEPIEKNFAVKEIAEKLGVDENLLRRQIREKFIKAKDENVSKQMIHADEAEDLLLFLFLENAQKWSSVIFRYIKYENIKSNKILVQLYNDFEQNKINNEYKIIRKFSHDPETASYLSGLMARREDKSTDRSKLCFDAIVDIKKRNLEKMIGEYREKIRRAQQNNKNVSVLRDKFVKLRMKLLSFKDEFEKKWKCPEE